MTAVIEKLLGATILILGVVALGALIGPDYAYLGTYYSLIAAFASLAFLLWPIAIKRTVPLARGTFIISLCIALLLAYWAAHITMGRPPWWRDGLFFLGFLGIAGGALVGVSYLLIEIGHIQRHRPLHIFVVCAIIAVGFTLSWYLAPN